MRKLIKLEKDENIVFNQNITEFFASEEIYMPIKENYHLLVKPGDYVYKGQIIIENNLNKVLSPVSGIVGSTVVKNVDDVFLKCLNIHNDFKEKSKTIRKKDIVYTKDTLINRLYECYFKYIASVFESKKINNLVISGIDDEPYILNNSYILNKYAKEILNVTDLLSSTFDINHTVIAIKNTQNKTIEKYVNKIGTYPNIGLSFIEDKYLLGNSFFLLEYLGLSQIDSLVIDVKTIVNIYDAIYYGHLPSETFISISGPCVSKNQVLKVKIGASLEEIINNNVKIKDNDVQFILNGLMTGHGCDIKNVIITNQTSGLIVIPNIKEEELKCNNCGLCYRICPVKINPKKAMDKKEKSANCIDCGLCSYICPCHINLRKFLRSENE